MAEAWEYLKFSDMWAFDDESDSYGLKLEDRQKVFIGATKNPGASPHLV